MKTLKLPIVIGLLCLIFSSCDEIHTVYNPPDYQADTESCRLAYDPWLGELIYEDGHLSAVYSNHFPSYYYDVEHAINDWGGKRIIARKILKRTIDDNTEAGIYILDYAPEGNMVTFSKRNLDTLNQVWKVEHMNYLYEQNLISSITCDLQKIDIQSNQAYDFENLTYQVSYDESGQMSRLENPQTGDSYQFSFSDHIKNPLYKAELIECRYCPLLPGNFNQQALVSCIHGNEISSYEYRSVMEDGQAGVFVDQDDVRGEYIYICR